MKTNETKTMGLAELIRKIDCSLELVKTLGKGGYGGVFKVKGDKHYRLKISLGGDVSGSYDTLEREYKILKDLASKTDAVLKPIKLYGDAPCILYGIRGKHAYLTEFVEGEVLSKSDKQSDVFLTAALCDLVEKVHKAGYKFTGKSDLNADNILLGKDGKLYLLDPMFLVPLKEEIPFGMTTEERTKVNEIIRRCRY